MTKLRPKALLIIFLFFAAVLFYAPTSYSGPAARRFYSVSEPMLLYPTTDNIDLSGKEYLEFKWWRSDPVWTDHYIFKLYRGYNTTAQTLIFKQEYSRGEYPIKIPASQFEAGQVYTWTLVQVFIGGKKSDRSHSSFKIMKK